MALQNRVRPNGQIISASWRGTLMGNRGGRIHDPETKKLTGRQWASRRWICCKLDFKGRQRTIMGNSYTELFFLDEASALAAGHRPCFECRRPDAKRFAETWADKFGQFKGSKADAMDRVLHEERLAEQRPLSNQSVADLPAGSMVRVRGSMFARTIDRWFRWSGDGYTPDELPVDGTVRLLTPPTVVELFRAGYQPMWHESAH